MVTLSTSEYLTDGNRSGKLLFPSNRPSYFGVQLKYLLLVHFIRSRLCIFQLHISRTLKLFAFRRSPTNILQFQSSLQNFVYSYGLVRFCVSERVCACVRLCVSVTFVRTGHTLAKIKIVKNDVCIFCYLPSNGVSVKMLLLDLDLNF